MNKSMIIILILLVLSSILSAKSITETFKFSQDLVELSLANIKVQEVSFISGNKIEIKCTDDEVIFNHDKHYLGISSPKKKAKIWIKLPESKKYHVVIEDGNFYFDKKGLTLITGTSQEIFVDGKILKVTKVDEEVIVFENGDLMINSDKEVVTINESGIIVTSDGFRKEDGNLTNFWGQMLASIIRVAARTAMNAIGDTPEEVIRTSLNEYNWRVDVDDMMDVVESNAPSFGRKDHFREVVKTFPASDIANLSLDNFNGKINVEGTDNNQLEVNIMIYADAEEKLEDVEIEFKGKSDLRIISNALKPEHQCSIEYEIKLPKNISLNEVISSNGSISVTRCMGDGKLTTSNGSIKVEDYTGDLILRTSNGSIEVESIKGDADIRTNNGSIDAENVSGKVYARTSNAKVEIENCPDIRQAVTSNGKVMLNIISLYDDLVVNTSNADIIIILSQAVNCDIQARTSNGKINLQDIKLDIIRSTRSYLKAKYNGGGKLLDVETSNASIKIYKQ